MKTNKQFLGIPKKIRIGSSLYTIVLEENCHYEGDTVQGYCDRKFKKEIHLNCLTKHSVADTLLHEILHAVYYEYGIYEGIEESKDKEERFVNTFAFGLTDILKKNKSLRDYFYEQWKH